jgi:hypothetical protein
MIGWRTWPLAAMTLGSVISIVDSEYPGRASGRPASRRPKVATYTFGFCRVPYEKSQTRGSAFCVTVVSLHPVAGGPQRGR